MPFQSHYERPRDDPRIVQAEHKAEFISCLIAGNNAMIEGKYTDAALCYEKAVRVSPNYYLPHARAGHAHYKLGDHEKAIGFLKRALELNANQVDTVYRLARCYQELDKPVQAAVAFDMARDLDDDGRYQERIRERLHQVKQETDPDLPRVSVPGVVIGALHAMIARPKLLLPFVTYYVATTALVAFLNATLLGRLNAGLPAFDLNNKTSLVYYGILLLGNLFIGVPFFASAIAIAGAFLQKNEASFRKTLRRTYGRLPHLLGVTFLTGLMLVSAGLFGIVASVLLVFNNISPAYMRFANFAGVAAVGLFAPFFAFQYQYIIIGRRSFEQAVTESFRMGGRRYLNTLVIFALCGLPFAAIVKISMSSNFVQYIFVSALRIPMMCYAVTMLTVYFYRAAGLDRAQTPPPTWEDRQKQREALVATEQQEDAFEPPRKIRRSRKKTESPAQEPPPPLTQSELAELEQIPGFNPETDPFPEPALPDDLVLEEHVNLPEHLRRTEYMPPEIKDADPGM